MLDLNSILQGTTLFLSLVLAGLIYLVKRAAEAAVQTSAEETAKATIQQLTWPGELARELQKTRGVERQESRYTSYGGLWEKLRPLAIYDATIINKKAASDLSAKLSDWYFSQNGGLLLTPQARDFYFALQDLLRAISKVTEDWVVERPEKSGDERRLFLKVLEARKVDAAINALTYVTTGAVEDWQKKAAEHAKGWREGINKVADDWKNMGNAERFVTLQQVGSVLRTSLTNDLESRLL